MIRDAEGTILLAGAEDFYERILFPVWWPLWPDLVTELFTLLLCWDECALPPPVAWNNIVSQIPVLLQNYKFSDC